MLGHQQRRPDELAQLTMGELGDSTITIGVLVPQAACRIACPPYLEGIAKNISIRYLKKPPFPV
jgi:hypothetical protein